MKNFFKTHKQLVSLIIKILVIAAIYAVIRICSVVATSNSVMHNPYADARKEAFLESKKTQKERMSYQDGQFQTATAIYNEQHVPVLYIIDA